MGSAACPWEFVGGWVVAWGGRLANTGHVSEDHTAVNRSEASGREPRDGWGQGDSPESTELA